MIYSVFFCGGVVVGLAAAIPILAIFWIGAHKAALIKVNGDLLSSRVEAMNAKKRVDESIAKLRSGHPDMTREQEEIARKEFEAQLFTSRYNVKPGQHIVPAGKD